MIRKRCVYILLSDASEVDSSPPPAHGGPCIGCGKTSFGSVIQMETDERGDCACL